VRLKLDPGERVIVITRPQARRLFWPAVAFLVVLAAGGFGAGWLSREDLPAWLADWRMPLLLIGLLLAVLLAGKMSVLPLLRWLGTRYLLTNRRLIIRQGWGRRREHQLLLASIFGLATEQNLLQRMLRSGQLRADVGYGRYSVLPDVPEVVRFRSLVVKAIEDLPRTAMFDGVDVERLQEMEYGEEGWQGDDQQ